VLGFTFLVSLVTGIIFGVAPAWMASRSDPAEALRGATRTTQETSALPQKSLVVVQAALSLVLLTVAGLLTESLRNLQNQQYGFERQGRILVEFNPNSAGYTAERLPGLYQQLEDRFSHMPGVIGESMSLYTAQQANNWSESIHILGHTGQEQTGPSWDRVSAHYFETIGTPVLRGRGFTEHDTRTASPVAVVNEAFASRFFPNTDPIGQHFGKGDASHAGDYEIVGVVKSAVLSQHRSHWPAFRQRGCQPCGRLRNCRRGEVGEIQRCSATATTHVLCSTRPDHPIQPPRRPAGGVGFDVHEHH
jgi:hypothetical protein